METRGPQLRPQLTQSVFEHDTWQRFWAHGFVQCPFATNNAHKLSFAAEEAAITTKTGILETAQLRPPPEQSFFFQKSGSMHLPSVPTVSTDA